MNETLRFIFPSYFINPSGAVSSLITYESLAFSDSIFWFATSETIPSAFVLISFLVIFPVTENVAGLFVTAWPFLSTFINMTEYFPDTDISFLSLKFLTFAVFFKFSKFWFLAFTITFAVVAELEYIDAIVSSDFEISPQSVKFM